MQRIISRNRVKEIVREIRQTAPQTPPGIALVFILGSLNVKLHHSYYVLNISKINLI